MALGSNIVVTVAIVLINKKIFDEFEFPGAVTARCARLAVTDPLAPGALAFPSRCAAVLYGPLEPSHLHCAIVVHAIPASWGYARPKP